ncbi:DVU3141 family protein [Teichococcus deserti]|uniref:DVU3141 family protein n=1 Tax=Teichococcus deserti TaxID=1817963 RepID=UPI001F61D896|nr:DVU3141 family protein [Pseudoroseomonas deserti]
MSGKSSDGVFRATLRGRPIASAMTPVAPAMRAAALGLAGLALAGCSSLSSMGLGGGSGSVPPARGVEMPPPRMADPLANFVATTLPGNGGLVAPAEGQAPVRVQVVRGYNSAAGRECRELQVGQGVAPRAAIYCKEPSGAWAAVKPLLRGGAVARP